MQHIADELGISKNAVSLALNDKPGVSGELREKITGLAAQLGYYKNVQKKARNNNVLLIMDDGRENDSDFYFPTISATIRYAKERNYNVLLTGVSTEIQEQLIIPKAYYDTDAVGAMFIGDIKKEFIQKFIENDIPTVLMVQHFYGIATDNVLSANEDGGYAVTKHLIEMGHTKIGFIADIGTYESFSKRFYGYKKALFDAGISENREYELVSCSKSVNLPENSIDSYMERISKIPDKPTAWLCGNDNTAIAFINEFRKRGVRVPEDVSVAGYDASPRASFIHPSLTTYDANIENVARHSVDLIINHIEGEHSDWNPVVVSVMGKLIKGESVRRMDC